MTVPQESLLSLGRVLRLQSLTLLGQNSGYSARVIVLLVVGGWWSITTIGRLPKGKS